MFACLSLCHRRPFALLLIALWVMTREPAGAEEIRHRFIAADSSKGRIALIDETGATAWEHRIGPLHDLQWLPDDRLLFQISWTRLVEVDLNSGKTVWEYEARSSDGPVEVHAFQRLENGRTMIAESGPARIIEVDPQGTVLTQIDMRVDRPHPHHDTRLVRKTGRNYLVCHENDGAVREYDAQGDVVWDYRVPLFDRDRRPGHGVDAWGNQCFAALRLPDGNTLITTGNGHGLIEVTPEGEVAWRLEQHDLPGIELAWVTTVQVLHNGHYVIGNCHAGPDNPQIIELNRDKEVLWTFRDFERFGDSLTNSWIIEPPQDSASE